MADKPIDILLIEDDEDDYLLARDLLAEIGPRRYALSWARDFDSGLAELSRQAHDLYLLDYRIGVRTGLELLEEARRRDWHAPMILLTSLADRETDVAAMGAGAADYLVKGQINAPLLERSIRYSLERARNLAILREREAELLQAQKMEAIGRLAGGIAHDFNNLLTAITGYGDLLLERLGGDGDAERDVREIMKAAGRAAALTRQLLTFSRKQSARTTVLDLNGVVRDIEPMLRRIIGEHIVLEVKTGAVPAPLRADAAQIEQVVMNLAVNARDAMPQGGRLSIAVDSMDSPPVNAKLADGPCVRLAVGDSGIGMDEPTLARIFEPFFTTKGPDMGTGLGLSTIYAIVAQSGGAIDVASTPGKGSRFELLFPKAAEPVTVETRPAAHGTGPAGTATVLLVEDQHVVRKLVRRLLKSEGYTVLEAEHGAEAIEVAEGFNGPIDLLITDMVMPRMSGEELAARMIRRRPRTKVLYVSGYADSEIFHGAGRGDSHFLQKPFSPEALSAKVREVLGNESVGERRKESRR